MKSHLSCLSTILVLAIGSACTTTEASQSKLWGDLKPGSYGVGYTVKYVLDPNRTWTPTINGADFQPDLRGRPIRISLWFPAKPTSGGRHLTFGECVQSPGAPPEFAKIDQFIADLTHYNVRILGPKYRDLESMPVEALVGAKPADGKFPLVLSAGGLSSESTTNLVMDEYLASHGYVVAALTSVGSDNERLEQLVTPPDIDGYVRDFEVAAVALRSAAYVDPAKTAMVGWSLGGTAALSFAMRNDNLLAAIALDGTYGFATGGVQSITNSYGFAPLRVHSALLDLRRKGTKQDLSVVDACPFADRTYAVVPRMRHTGFSVWASIGCNFAPDAATQPEDGWNSKAGFEGYQKVCQIVAGFLDAKVKSVPGAMDSVKKEVDTFAEGIESIWRHTDGVPFPPNLSQFVEIVKTQGFEAAAKIVDQYRRDLPNVPVVNADLANDNGYFALEFHRYDEAIACFRLVAYAYPESANAADSLGDGYSAAGKKGNAIEAFELAAKLAPNDKSINDKAKASFIEGEKKKIQQLKGRLAP